MIKHILILSLMLGVLENSLNARVKKNSSQQLQAATVVSVDKRASLPLYVGSPTDAPLQADDFTYDIGIRSKCSVYIGRYESSTDYLPLSFTPHHKVDVLFQKHVMYVRAPESDRAVKMGIVGHKHLTEDGCSNP